MSEMVNDDRSTVAMEILPPEVDRSDEAAVCLCCQRHRRAMDADGCGICDECLLP